MTDVMRETFGEMLPASERARRLVGKTLDGYRLEEITKGGEGGFGVVYKASHPEIGKVAVKVLGIDIRADKKAYQRFKREVELLCEMGQARNVVNIRHAGIEDGLPWFAMEYVDGDSLHQWLGKKKINKDDLITILSDVLEGLHQVQVECKKKRPDTRTSETGRAATSKNDGPPTSIVHRDIKPGNVMIVEHESGEMGAMLIDFGIAGLFRERMEDVPITNTSIPSMGTEFHRAYTPEYTSPELCLSPKSVTVQSDIFQVGLIAYEMMTGKRYWNVWPGAAKELKKAKGWPWWLKKVIARSLNWDQTKRFSSPLEFKRALNQPFREVMKSLVVKPKRLAASIAAVAIVVLAVLLTMKIVDLSDMKLKSTRLEDENRRLRIAAAGLRRNNEDLAGRNALLQKGNDGPKTPSDLAAMRKDICATYDAFLGRNITSKFIDLKEKCRLYLKKDRDSGSKTEFCEFANDLLKWMAVAEKGKIQIIPKKFEESDMYIPFVSDGGPIDMRYRFSQGNLRKESETISVDGVKKLSNETHKNCPPLTVRWVPGGEKIVIEVEQLDDGEVKNQGKHVWAITGNIIHKSKTELSEYQTLSTKDDSNYKLSYTIGRKDFGPIPKPPALAK